MFLSIFILSPCFSINSSGLKVQETKRGSLYDYKETTFKFANSEFVAKLSNDYQKINIKYQSVNDIKNFSLDCDSYVEELRIRKVNEKLYWFSAESLGFEQYFILNLQTDNVYEPFFDMKNYVDINIIDYENQVLFGDTWNSDKGIMPDQTVELYLFSTAKKQHYKIAEKKGSEFNVKILDDYKIEYTDQNGNLIKYDYSDWIGETVLYNASSY